MVEEQWYTLRLPGGRSRVLRTRYLDSCIRQAIARDGRPPARRFYKYMKAKYANMMVNDGVIRVGSLVDYQNAEKYSGGVLDEAEGTRTTVVKAGDHEVWTAENMPEPVRAILGSIPAHQVWHVHGTTFNAVYVANAFVYCLSSKYDETLLDESEFNGDAIVEIVDTTAFFAAVDGVMRAHECRFFNAVECKYVGRVHADGDERTLHHAVGVKEEGYRHQAECRLVWRARDDKVEKPEVMVSSPAITLACRRIY